MINPFPWQEECLAAWLAAGGRGIAHVATGAGKTVMALMAVKALEERLRTELRVKVVVPKVFLAAQWADAIVKIYGAGRAEVGICSGTVKESRRKFTVYVVNTARLCAARHIAADFAAGRAVFLIGDECHRLGSEENAHVFDFLHLAGPDNYFALGLSATPDCERYESVIVPALGREIYGYGIREAAAARVVADFAAHGVGLTFTEAEADDYEELTEKLSAVVRKLLKKCPFLRALSGNQFLACLNRLAAQKDEIGDLASAARFLMFRRKEIVYLARARILCAVELARRQPVGSRVIFFLERIEMADELYAALLPVYGGRICRYHSEMSDEEKRRALETYRDGEALALVCCRALDEGLDIPDTDAGVLVAATSAPRQRIQRLGRLLRRGGGRAVKDIYYFYIAGFVEETLLLPELPRGEDLFFDHTTGAIQNPPYDALAAGLRRKLAARGVAPRLLEEVERNLRLGAIRRDYRERAAPEYRAAEKSERNYWVTMRLLSGQADERELDLSELFTHRRNDGGSEGV
jgi:superfamily II DNA or RNA helicase